MKPCIPVYHRAPNKFIRYEERRFDNGIEKVAIFLDKKGRQCEMTAQVIWRKK